MVMGEGDRMTDSAALSGAPLALEEVVVTGVHDYASVGSAGLALDEMVVRGFKVASIEWEERVPGEKALLIRQLLSAGDTLELRYLGMLLGTDPDPLGVREGGLPLEEAPGSRVYANVLEATLPPGWNQVVMEWGRGWLVARAPIPEANLKALLKTLH